MAHQGEVPEVKEIKFGGNVGVLVETGLKLSTFRRVKPDVGPYYEGLTLWEPVAATHNDGYISGDVVPLDVKQMTINQAYATTAGRIMMLCDGWLTPSDGCKDLDSWYAKKYGPTDPAKTPLEGIAFLPEAMWNSLQGRDQMDVIGHTDSPEKLFCHENQDLVWRSMGFWMLSESQRQVITEALLQANKYDMTPSDVLVKHPLIDLALKVGYNRAHRLLGLGDECWSQMEIDFELGDEAWSAVEGDVELEAVFQDVFNEVEL